jgi:UDP-2-acetamido-2,6-beta-L-arabino-hexul-4-ose reductase
VPYGPEAEVQAYTLYEPEASLCLSNQSSVLPVVKFYMKVKIEQLNTRTDLRGFVFEPVAKELLASQKNCHVVISAPDAIRGNHSHLHGTETIAVTGPALLRFREENDIYDVEVPSKQVYKFVIPPKVAHAIKNTGKKENLLIAFNSVAHHSKNPDVIGEILMSE